MFAQHAELHSAGFDQARAGALLEKEGLAALVVTSPENVFYTTGYPTLPTSGNPILYSLRNVFPHAVVIGRSGDRHLLCWGFSLEDVSVDAEEVVAFNDRAEAMRLLGEQVAARAGEAGGASARVGIESSCPYEVAELLASLGPVELAGADPVLYALRRRKSAREIELLRRSVEVAEGALERVIASLRVGASRLDAIRLAKSSVLELGGDGVGHVTMSFGQANPEIAIDERLREGALAVVDVGAKLAGYTSDCRRYAYVGEKVPDVVLEQHAAMCAVVDEVAEAMRPGVSFAELTRLGRQGFSSRAIPLLGRFTHVGHGIGLVTEEEWIDDDESRAIEEDMVVAIELYAAAGEHGSVGDEETYVIRSSGPERLSLLERSIRMVVPA
jgi:Xaa-Pro aminopeptidase